jgi:hypothetical protein
VRGEVAVWLSDTQSRGLAETGTQEHRQVQG